LARHSISAERAAIMVCWTVYWCRSDVCRGPEWTLRRLQPDFCGCAQRHPKSTEHWSMTANANKHQRSEWTWKSEQNGSFIRCAICCSDRGHYDVKPYSLVEIYRLLDENVAPSP
jgi:hypothetical protein